MPAPTYPAQFESDMVPAIYRYVVAALGGPATISLDLGSVLGATVPTGSTVTHDLSGQVWTLESAVVIPALGSASGVFTTDGPAAVGIGDVFTIDPPVAGWDTVSNAAAAVSFPWTVFFARQDGDDRRAPRPPAKPFAKVQFLELPEVEGRQWSEMYDTSPTELRAVVRNVALIRTEIQLFADTDERVLAERARSNLDLLYPGLDNLSVAGLVPVPSEVRARDLSAIFSSENEFRYLLEVGFRVETRHVVEDYPYIETVQPLTVDVQ